MSRIDSDRETTATAADFYQAGNASLAVGNRCSASESSDDEPVSAPGMTLRQLVHRTGPLLPDRAVRIVARAARVLAEAHSSGTVHGELTPDDVMIMSIGGERDYVQLPELGAERDPDYVPDSGFTTPEAAGGLPCDARSDLYSLGALLFFALTGRPPYQGTDRELLRAQLFAPPPSLAGTSPRRVSRVLDAFVRRCLMKNPAARPESADDLASTLLAIPATEAPLTSDAEAAARMRRARLWGRGWPVVLPRRAFQFDTGSLGHCTALDDPPETIRRRRDDAGVLGTLGAIEPEPPSLDGLSLEAMMETSLDAEGKAQSPIARVERTTLPPPPVHISTLPPPSTVPRRLLGTPCLATLPSPPFPGYEVRAFPRRNGGSTPPSLR